MAIDRITGGPGGGMDASDGVGAVLGRLAASHPGVGFALHAHQPHGVLPPGVTPGQPPMGLAPPQSLPGGVPMRVGSPGQGFGETAPRAPQAPRGPQGVRKPPPATTGKPPRVVKPHG